MPFTMRILRRKTLSSLLALCWMSLADLAGLANLTGLAAAAEKQPAAPLSVSLAADGRAKLPIVIPAKPSERVRKIANDLASLLGRISGAAFAVESGDGQTGIAVGRAVDFPELWLANVWDAGRNRPSGKSGGLGNYARIGFGT
jgi:hypothetical protein